jgi:hypothetical protein
MTTKEMFLARSWMHAQGIREKAKLGAVEEPKTRS